MSSKDDSFYCTNLEKALRMAFVRLGVFVNDIARPTRFVVFLAFLMEGKTAL